MIDMVAIVNQFKPFEEELLQADALLPVQFHNGHVHRATTEPLRRLMVAILVDAIRYFETNLESSRSAGLQEFAEARSWIFSDDDNGCFAFLAVCDALGIDPKAIRKGLAESQEMTGIGKRPRWIMRRSAPAAKRISG
jgi:hypothetical protein